MIHIRTWQLIAFWAIAVLGAQLPMYVLAASIDNDEHAKSALGWLTSAVFATIAASVLYVLVSGRLPQWMGQVKQNDGDEEE